MKVVILSARTGWHTDELSRALAERGHEARVLPYEKLVARIGTGRAEGGPEGPPLRDASVDGSLARVEADLQVRLDDGETSIFDADAVLARIVPDGSLEQIIYRVDALHWIEARGTPVMNSPRAIERSVDKFYTTALLQEVGLPTPETVVCESASDAMTAIRSMLERPGACGVVLKPMFGSMGHGLVRVSDPDVALRVVRVLERLRSVFYIQQAVDHGGRDLRVFIVGDRVVGAIERRAAGDDWRTNVARGGMAHPVLLPPAWGALARRAAAVVGADYAGVDLLPTRDGGVFVLEVNGIPGWQGLQRVIGIDVAGVIVEHLAARVAARGAADAHMAGAAGLPA